MKKIVLFFVAMVVSLATFAQDVTSIEVTTMKDLKANEGKRVLYKGLEPAAIEVESFFGTETMYLMPDSVTALNYTKWPVPAKMDVYGTLTEEGFTIEEVVQIYAFFSIADLQYFFVDESTTNEQKAASYEIVDPFTVTLVNPMGYYYVQYEQPMAMGSAYLGMMVQMGGGLMPLADDEAATSYIPAVGDQIKLKGIYVPAEIDEESGVQMTNTMFVQETVTFVSKDNELELFSYNDYGLDLTFDGSYGKLTGGNIEEEDGMYTYKLNVYGETFSIPLEIAGDVDFAKYNSTLSLCGVLVYDTYLKGFRFLAVEIKDTRLLFDNIATLLATEQTRENALQMWYLKNPVAVTAVVHEKGLFVEDASGALFLDQTDSIKTVAVGDSIIGIGGFYNPRQQMGAPTLTVDLANVTVLNSNNTLVPTEVTIAELMKEYDAVYTESALASTWANRLVTIKGVTTAIDSENEKFGWFIQGEDSLFYNTLMLNAAPGTNEWVTSYGYTFYPKMNLTGIVDYACLNPNYDYSFFPRSQADIEEVKGGAVNVENLEMTADIYTENGLIVAEGEFEVFTVTGQNVTDMNGNLPGGVYVVRTATSVGKIVVK